MVIQQDDLARLQAADDLWRVAGSDELNAGKCFFQRGCNGALPAGVKVDVQFIDHDDAVCLA